MGFLDLAGESGASRGDIGLLKQEIAIETHFVFSAPRALLDDVCMHASVCPHPPPCVLGGRSPCSSWSAGCQGRTGAHIPKGHGEGSLSGCWQHPCNGQAVPGLPSSVVAVAIRRLLRASREEG